MDCCCNLRLPRNVLYEGNLKYCSHKVPNSIFNLSFFSFFVRLFVWSLSDHFSEIKAGESDLNFLLGTMHAFISLYKTAVTQV